MPKISPNYFYGDSLCGSNSSNFFGFYGRVIVKIIIMDDFINLQ